MYNHKIIFIYLCIVYTYIFINIYNIFCECFYKSQDDMDNGH